MVKITQMVKTMWIRVLVIILLFPIFGYSPELPVTVGTSGSKASLDTNFGNIHSNFTELYAIDARNYGAVESSTISSAEAVQAAVDAAEAAGGGVVDIPIAIALDDTITIDSNYVLIRGRGFSAPITVLGDYGDVFKFTGNPTTGVMLQRIGVQDVYLTTSVARSSGSFLDLEGVMFGSFENIWMSNGFNGITLKGSSQLVFDSIYHTNASVSGQTSTGRRLLKVTASSGNYAGKNGGGVFFNNFNLRGLPGTDLVEDIIEINTIDGIWFSNGHVGNGTEGNILLNASIADSVLGFVFFNNVMSDSTLGDGIIFRGNSVEAARISFGNMTLAGGSTGQNAIHAEPGCTFSDITFTSPIASGFDKRAFFNESATFRKVSLTGVMFAGNSFNTVGGYPNVEFADGTGWTTITGGTIGYKNASYLNTAGNTTYAVELGSNLVNIAMSNIDMRKNQSGSINGQGSATCKFSNILTDDSTTLASAAMLEVPRTRTFITITGTTDITSITAHDAGKIIYLRFSEPLTVVSGNNLILQGDIATTSGSTLALISDGAEWRELSRRY